MAKVLEKLPFDNIDGGVWKQGYPIKYKPIESESEKLKVFVIPHSHCDPGLCKPMNNNQNYQIIISNNGIRNIISSLH